MTSQSKWSPPGKVEEQVVASLEDANQQLSQEALSDIARARHNALAAARIAAKERHSWFQELKRWQFPGLVNNIKFAAPVALAVTVGLLVSYTNTETIPVLPAEILSGDVPLEELAMLEELEFASWLAEQEQEGRW